MRNANAEKFSLDRFFGSDPRKKSVTVTHTLAPVGADFHARTFALRLVFNKGSHGVGMCVKHRAEK
jgi:hypothetical protein